MRRKACPTAAGPVAVTAGRTAVVRCSSARLSVRHATGKPRRSATSTSHRVVTQVHGQSGSKKKVADAAVAVGDRVERARCRRGACAQGARRCAG